VFFYGTHTLLGMRRFLKSIPEYTKVFFKVLSLATVFLFRTATVVLTFLLKVLNIIPNIQWKKDLNILQNIAYNMYIPSSKGVPSMHSSLLTFSIMALAVTFMSELYRFYINPEYNFSTGFYTNIGALGGLIITAFSWKSYKETLPNQVKKESLDNVGLSESNIDPAEAMQDSPPPISISKSVNKETDSSEQVPKKKMRKSKK
jgi:hypothetical protein